MSTRKNSFDKLSRTDSANNNSSGKEQNKKNCQSKKYNKIYNDNNTLNKESMRDTSRFQLRIKASKCPSFSKLRFFNQSHSKFITNSQHKIAADFSIRNQR